MTRRSRPQPGWPWAALLLLVGVLAMHGLVSTDHAAHRAETAISASAPASAPAHHGDVVDAGPALPAGLDLRDVVVGAVGLCLAVLVAGLLLPRLRRGWSRVQPALLARTRPVWTSPPGRGPPRLLLAQLCVLRT